MPIYRIHLIVRLAIHNPAAMPSIIDLNQVVAKAERRPLAGLCFHLIEEALELPPFREILQTGPRPDDELIKGTGLDQLDANRLQELQAVLQGLQDLKKRQQS